MSLTYRSREGSLQDTRSELEDALGCHFRAHACQFHSNGYYSWHNDFNDEVLVLYETLDITGAGQNTIMLNIYDTERQRDLHDIITNQTSLVALARDHYRAQPEETLQAFEAALF
ncbi:hypothetical protein [Halomonas huangheensis]|uniref:Uncharacterized protein n=1 Tax=Halomonas huangheensis TaxID=1178482 RepID=W1N6L0_9GAMM|nr:hypothetical protein [Halomonas huangheensis]ALM54245.1 hypothetical protein AR456_19710 [Halomonas huangheensis]ERL50791.1 hypothetical protein BJB45_19540 [Halomonas huangheensis]